MSTSLRPTPRGNTPPRSVRIPDDQWANWTEAARILETTISELIAAGTQAEINRRLGHGTTGKPVVLGGSRRMVDNA